MKLLLAVVASMLCASAAHAVSRSSFDAGQKLAAKRGLSGDRASCVANVFARNATIGPRGGWTVGETPKGLAAYQSDLRRTCGVKN